jgi:hypothetical protein
MCTGLEIAAIASVLGSAAAAGGTYMSQQEASQNAQRAADARNRELQATLARTKKLGEESRNIYKQREQEIAPEAAQQSHEDATASRTATLEGAIPDSAPEAVPLSGSAPTVVKSEIAQKLLDATGEAKTQARALGKIGGYGDMWFNEGLSSNNADRRLSVPQNFIQNEMALLPFSQDFAEYGAYRPSSGVGEIMAGVGNVVASAGGAYGGKVAGKAPVAGAAPITQANRPLPGVYR